MGVGGLGVFLTHTDHRPRHRLVQGKRDFKRMETVRWFCAHLRMVVDFSNDFYNEILQQPTEQLHNTDTELVAV